MQEQVDKRAGKAALDEQIIENLRRVYNQKLEESVPDRFLDLLRQLKDQDGGGDGFGAGVGDDDG